MVDEKSDSYNHLVSADSLKTLMGSVGNGN